MRYISNSAIALATVLATGRPPAVVRAGITTADVLLDGQKVQSTRSATLVAEKPDRLRLDVTDEHQQRLFLYDGKTFTLYAPRSSYYATVPAPPTTIELARTTLTDDARPQHTAVYMWNLAPSISADAYAFVPPKDAKKITFAEAKVAQSAAKKQEEQR